MGNATRSVCGLLSIIAVAAQFARCDRCLNTVIASTLFADVPWLVVERELMRGPTKTLLKS